MSARKPIDTTRYDALNLEFARRVLANPNVAQYEDGAMVKWARMVVERIEGFKSLSRQEPVEGKEQQ